MRKDGRGGGRTEDLADDGYCEMYFVLETPAVDECGTEKYYQRRRYNSLISLEISLPRG